MTDKVLQFAPLPERLRQKRHGQFAAGLDLDTIEYRFGSAEEWCQSAVAYVKSVIGDRREGTAELSVAAVRFLLGFADTLETAGAFKPEPEDAA